MAPEREIFHPKHLGKKMIAFRCGTFWNINGNISQHFNHASDTHCMSAFTYSTFFPPTTFWLLRRLVSLKFSKKRVNDDLTKLQSPLSYPRTSEQLRNSAAAGQRSALTGVWFQPELHADSSDPWVGLCKKFLGQYCTGRGNRKHPIGPHLNRQEFSADRGGGGNSSRACLQVTPSHKKTTSWGAGYPHRTPVLG